MGHKRNWSKETSMASGTRARARATQFCWEGPHFSFFLLLITKLMTYLFLLEEKGQRRRKAEIKTHHTLTGNILLLLCICFWFTSSSGWGLSWSCLHNISFFCSWAERTDRRENTYVCPYRPFLPDLLGFDLLASENMYVGTTLFERERKWARND